MGAYQGGFRDQHGAVQSVNPNVEQPKAPQPDPAAFCAALTPDEAASVARDGVNVRTTSEASSKPKFTSVLEKANRYNIPKDRALEIAIEVARSNEQHRRAAEARADGGTVSRSPLSRLDGLTNRQLAALGLGAVVAVTLLS